MSSFVGTSRPRPPPSVVSSRTEPPSAKRAKKQYSCTECFRRKQRCDRIQPCNHCIKRGTEGLCHIPCPTNPPRNSTASEHGSASNQHRRSLRERSSSRSPSVSSTHVTEATTAPTTAFSASAHQTGSRPSKAQRRSSQSPPRQRDDQLAALQRQVQRLESALSRFTEPSSRSRRDSPVRDRRSPPATSRMESATRPQKRRLRSASHDHSATDESGSDEATSSNALRPGPGVHGGYFDAEIGYLGASAIESIRETSGLFLNVSGANGGGSGGMYGGSGYVPRAFETGHTSTAAAAWARPNGTHLGGIPIPREDIAEIHRSLPDRQRCQTYLDVFFTRFNWSRYKIGEPAVRRKVEMLYGDETLLQQSASTFHQLPFISLLLGILAVGSLGTPDVQMVPEESNDFFWASKKCLIACENLAITNLDSCWTYATHIRYLDLVRAPRTSWYSVGSWIRLAVDLGLHSETQVNGSDAERSERRVLWSHILQCESEWSLALGRPLTILTDKTTGPTHGDMQDLDFAYREFVLGRKLFIPHFQGIVRFFTVDDRRTSRDEGYAEVQALDAALVDAAQRLPSYFQFLPGTEPDRSLDRHFEHLAFYRHMFAGMFHFYRILLHRPYFLHWIDERHPQHPYPRSWRLCVESALAEVRMRKVMAEELTADEQVQHYGAAYAAFSSAIILGFGILLDAGAGHCLCREETKEKIDFIAEVTYANADLVTARSNDNTAHRELGVLKTMLARMLAFVEPRISTHTHPAARGSNSSSNSSSANGGGGGGGAARSSTCSYVDAVRSIKVVMAGLSARCPPAAGTRDAGGAAAAVQQQQQQQQQRRMSRASVDTSSLAALADVAASPGFEPANTATAWTAAAAPGSAGGEPTSTALPPSSLQHQMHHPLQHASQPQQGDDARPLPSATTSAPLLGTATSAAGGGASPPSPPSMTGGIMTAQQQQQQLILATLPQPPLGNDDDALLDARLWNSLLGVLQSDVPAHEQPLFAEWLHQGGADGMPF